MGARMRGPMGLRGGEVLLADCGTIFWAFGRAGFESAGVPLVGQFGEATRDSHSSLR